MKIFNKLEYIIYALLLVAISSNKLQAQNLTANERIVGNHVAYAKSTAFQKMHLGLFVHYTYVGKPYQWGSTLWADTSKVKSLDELADNLDVNDLVATAVSMRAQFVVFTPFHANMQVLYPSNVIKNFLPGHCSKRYVIRDLISALKAKNIRRVGWIKDYVVFVSNDGKNWGDPVAKGIFTYDESLKTILFSKTVESKFIKFVAVTGFDIESPIASLAEISILS